MDNTNFLKSANVNHRTYAQFTPGQIDRLFPAPTVVPAPRIGSFPVKDFSAEFVRGRTLRATGDPPIRTDASVFTQSNGSGVPTRNNGNIFSSPEVARGFEGVGGAAGILGAASLAAPALLPVAAAAGVAYGVYKLGNTFDWW